MNEWTNKYINEWMNRWMNECMHEWMTEWMNERMHEWMNEWTNERTNEWMNEGRKEWLNEYMNARMDERMNGWMDGWMNEWMNEWMNLKTKISAKTISCGTLWKSLGSTIFSQRDDFVWYFLKKRFDKPKRSWSLLGTAKNRWKHSPPTAFFEYPTRLLAIFI